jgi:hypothetical protein
MNHLKCHHCPVAGTCVVERTGHRRFCEWLTEGKPGAQERILELSAGAGGGNGAAAYPPLAAQVGSVLGAAGRAIGAALTGVEVVRSGEEQAKCLAICQGCEHYVAADARCSICGCYALFKTRLATEHCPLDPPKW